MVTLCSLTRNVPCVSTMEDSVARWLAAVAENTRNLITVEHHGCAGHEGTRMNELCELWGGFVRRKFARAQSGVSSGRRSSCGIPIGLA